MNFRHVLIVFLKEMKDAFRDKKSVLTNILLPLVLIPALYFFMNFVQTKTVNKVKEDFNVGIVETSKIEDEIKFTKEKIIKEEDIKLVKFKTLEEAKESLEKEEITCIIDYHDEFFKSLEKGKVSKITILNDSTKSSSITATQMLQSKMTILNNDIAKDKLIEQGISPEILNLVVPVTEDVADVSKTTNAMQVIILIVPMYLISVVVSAGMPLALDIFAGERERNTFEALLSTKADRLSILVGKYLAVITFSVMSILTSFIGLVLGIILNKEMFGIQQGESILQAFNMPIPAFLLVVLSSLTLAVVFGGILIALSTAARTMKEAQTYMSYVMLPSMIPAFLTMMMQAGDVKLYMNFIPVLNTIASLKMVLGGIINYPYLIISVISNVTFGIIVTLFVIRMFNNEKIVIK